MQYICISNKKNNCEKNGSIIINVHTHVMMLGGSAFHVSANIGSRLLAVHICLDTRPQILGV